MKLNTASTRILAALLVGLGLGIWLAGMRVVWLPSAIAVAEPVGQMWMDALRMTIVPLVFSLLVTGIASSASAASAGGLATRALATFAVILTLVAVYGEVASAGFLALWPIPADAAAAMHAAMGGGAEVAAGMPLSQWLTTLIPTNPIKAAAEGEMLPLVLFAIVFGFAVIRLQAQRARTLIEFFQAIVDAMLVIVHWVILLGPIGVFALAFVVGARAGIGAAGALGHYLVMLVSVQVLLILLMYPAVRLWAGLRIADFARAVAPAQAVAASTQSSLASLPAMVESAQKLAIPARVSAMVLPMAVSVFRITSPVANIAVVLYCAALFGVEPNLGQYVAGVAMGVAMSFAAVGLPGQTSFFTSIVPISLVMGVPVAALPLLLAVEVVPDILRTVGNVTGDVGVTAGLARSDAAAKLSASEPATEAVP